MCRAILILTLVILWHVTGSTSAYSTYIYIYIYVYTYVRTYIHTYIYTHIHTHIYTHTHTYKAVVGCNSCVVYEDVYSAKICLDPLEGFVNL
jgi:hypothetical protein